MGVIDKTLELFRSPETGTEGIEIRHLISEGAVIRMLLKGHYLESIISKALYLWKNCRTELFE